MPRAPRGFFCNAGCPLVLPPFILKKKDMTPFEEIGIHNDIVRGLAALGFDTPTPVQKQVIPLMLEKEVDLVGLAQTGTGKTAAFGIPLIQLADAGNKQTQGLVLCPTRELCVQVAKDMTAFARYVPGVKVLAVYGGASMELQIKALRRGVQIIVATPGRLHDLIRRRKVDISAIRWVILDEADEMLQMGFQDELNAILAKTPKTKNTLLFSATMPKEVAAIAANYMTTPMEILIGQPNAGAENVRHEYYIVHAKDRYPALKRILDINPDIYSIIFCRTRQETKEVADRLIEDGYSADALHGELSQSQRDQVMDKFRRRNLQMLVATDVAARGLDVHDLTHVINYNLPDDITNYTHRSGRTGRAGKTGTSIAIIHMRERYRIREIEKKLKKRFEQCRIPSGYEICRKQLFGLIDTMEQIDVDHAQIDPLFPAIEEKLASLDREELIKRFVSFEFKRSLEYYRNAPDLNVSEGKNGQEQKRHKSGKQTHRQKFTRFFLNVGEKDGVLPQRLIGEINDVSDIPRIRIGKIEIMKNSALLEADSRFTPQILGAFQHLMINGKAVSVRVAREKGSRHGGENGRKGQKSSKYAKAGGRRVEG